MSSPRTRRQPIPSLCLLSAVVAAALLGACGDEPVAPVETGPLDAARSTVTVSRAAGVLSNGTDKVIVEVRVLDSNGLPIAGVNVNLAASGQGNVLTQPTAPTNGFGVATGSLASTVAEKKTLSASVGPEGIALEQRPSVEFVAWAPPAVSLTFQTGPSDVVAGATIAPAVQVAFEDASGKVAATEASSVTLELGENPGDAILGGTLTVSAVGGVATFSDLSIERPGAGYTLIARAEGMEAKTSAAFAVTTGAPASLEISGAPATTVAGEALSVTVTVRDGAGNAVEGYAGTVHFGSTDPAAQLPADYLFTAEDAGSATFEVTLVGAGPQTVTVADLESGASAEHALEVLAAPAAAIEVGGIGGGVAAGTRASVTLAVVDAFGNAVADYAGTVRFSSTDGQAVLPADYAFVAADAGTHTFVDGVELRTAGVQSVSATDTAANLTGSQTGIAVLAAAAQGLAFTTAPVDVRVREPMAAVVVAVVDGFANVVAASTDLVTLALGDNPGDGTLSGTLSVAAEGGIASFADLSIEADAAGYTLSASTDTFGPVASAAFEVFDDVAPGATALQVAVVGETNLGLAWTATGDDGALGKAASYELRYSTSPLDEANFAAATAVAVEAPAAPGTAEAAAVTGLVAGTLHYFGLKTLDNAGNAALEFVSGTPGCAAGYAGPTCADCAPGWESDGAGGCVEADVCLPNPCDVPPAGSCLGTVATSYPNPGVCADQAGQPICDYPPVELDCAISGQLCFEGACVATSAQIAAVRAAADGGGLLLPIDGALVTYVKPALGSEPGGFFVQAEQTGPALFVSDLANAVPAPVAGDRVSFEVTTKVTTSGVIEASGIANYVRASQGESLAALIQDLSAATDLVTALGDYESELIQVTGTLAADFGSAGGDYRSAQLSTSGVPDSALLKLRIPGTLQAETDLVAGCTLTVSGTPLWRYNDQAQPSAWDAAELTVTGCPAPRVLGAVATSLTTVVVTFDRRLDGASVVADGGQFTFDNGLVAVSAVAVGREVTVTTATQTGGTRYTVDVATTVLDSLGTAVDVAASQASFVGYVPPAIVRINELNANVADGCDLVELRVVQGGSMDGFKLMERTSDLLSFQGLIVATNDFVVVHLGSGSRICNPTGATSELLSPAEAPSATHAANSDAAWDWWSTDTGLTATDNAFTLYDGQDVVLDAVLVASAPTGTAASASETKAAELAAAGEWEMVGGGVPANGFVDDDFRAHAVLDLDATATDAAGTSIQRLDDADTDTKADWSDVNTSTWGALNPGQAAF